MHQDVPSPSITGRASAGAGSPENLTPTQTRTVIDYLREAPAFRQSFSGGGIVSWTSGKLKWSQRFIQISDTKGAARLPTASVALTEIVCPTSGTIDVVNAATATTVACDAGGIAWATLWQTLYFDATKSGDGSGAAQFKIVRFTENDFTVPPHWIPVATYIDEGSSPLTTLFPVKVSIAQGDTVDLRRGTLAAFMGDTGSGGRRGDVPAPAAGDAAAGKVLGAGGNWITPPASVGIIDGAYAENTVWSTLTNPMVFDDTVPAATAGTQIVSKSITPRATTNKVRAKALVIGTVNAAQYLMVSILRGGTVIATGAVIVPNPGVVIEVAAEVEDAPGSTAAQTYSVRVGTVAGSQAYINGTTTGRIFGGTARCTLTLDLLGS